MITPLIILISDPSVVQEQKYFKLVYDYLEVVDYNQFVIYISGITIVAFLLITFFVMIAFKKVYGVTAHLTFLLSRRLYFYYISRDWQYYVKNTNEHFVRKLFAEFGRFRSGVIESVMMLAINMALIFTILVIFIIISPYISLFSLLLFGSNYYLIYKFFRPKLSQYSHNLYESNRKIFRLYSQVFGGMKELKISDRVQNFDTHLYSYLHQYIDANTKVNTVSLVPRYFLELITIITTIIILLFFVVFQEAHFSSILPYIGIFAISGLKLLPALHATYSNLVNIKANISAVHFLKNDLYASKNMNLENNNIHA